MAFRPNQGITQARLRFSFKDLSWTEAYILGAGTPSSFLNTLNWLCRLRSVWLGKGVTISFASAADIGSPRDGVAADALPYEFSFTYPSGIGPINDVEVGYEYRCQSVKGFRTTRFFRAIPDAYISNMEAVGGAWLPNQANGFGARSAKLGTIYDIAPGSMGPVTASYTLAAQSLINFLCQKTYVLQPPVPPAVVPSVNAFDDVLFRRIDARRTGHALFKAKGRFSR